MSTRVRNRRRKTEFALAAGLITLGYALVAAITALAYVRNEGQPGAGLEQQDLIDGMTVATLGWLICVAALTCAALRPQASSSGGRTRSKGIVLVAVAAGLVCSAVDPAGQTEGTDRLSVMLWSCAFYVVGAVCLASTLAVVLARGADAAQTRTDRAMVATSASRLDQQGRPR